MSSSTASPSAIAPTAKVNRLSCSCTASSGRLAVGRGCESSRRDASHRAHVAPRRAPRSGAQCRCLGAGGGTTHPRVPRGARSARGDAGRQRHRWRVVSRGSGERARRRRTHRSTRPHELRQLRALPAEGCRSHGRPFSPVPTGGRRSVAPDRDEAGPADVLEVRLYRIRRPATRRDVCSRRSRTARPRDTTRCASRNHSSRRSRSTPSMH